MGKRQDGKGDQRVLMKQLISFTLTEKVLLDHCLLLPVIIKEMKENSFSRGNL